MDVLPLQPIVDHLIQARTPLREIGLAADMAAILAPGAIKAGPSAAVILTGVQALEVREGSGPLRQDLIPTFSVVVGMLLAGAKGAVGLKKIEEPLSAVRKAVFGWSHPGAVNKCWSAGEGIEEFDAKTGLLLYRLDFSTQVRIQEGS